MKYVIRIVLLILIGVLGYLTFDTVYSDIKYAEEVTVKEDAVIAKLKVLRDGQLAYRDHTGKFADKFDDLLEYMENGEMKVTIQTGSKDDSTTVFSSKEMMISVRDSLFKDIDIAKLRFVPGSDTMQFVMKAREITKNNVQVPVFEIVDPQPFSKERIKEDNALQVGSISDVNYNGNWN